MSSVVVKLYICFRGLTRLQRGSGTRPEAPKAFQYDSGDGSETTIPADVKTSGGCNWPVLGDMNGDVVETSRGAFSLQDVRRKMKLATTDWNEIKANIAAGLIPLPTGDWVAPPLKLLTKIKEDVWCETAAVLRGSDHERYLAVSITAFVAAGFCGASDESRLDWVLAQPKDHFEGDAFDWMNMYIDGARILAHEELGFEPLDLILDAFTQYPRHDMKRLAHRAKHPRVNRLKDRCLARMCWLTLAVKIQLARAGYPEFCQPCWS